MSSKRTETNAKPSRSPPGSGTDGLFHHGGRPATTMQAADVALRQHGFVLSPVPKPASRMLLGLAGLAGFRWWRCRGGGCDSSRTKTNARR